MHHFWLGGGHKGATKVTKSTTDAVDASAPGSLIDCPACGGSGLEADVSLWWEIDPRTELGACDLTLRGEPQARILERVRGYQAKILSEDSFYGPEFPYRQQAIEWAFRRLVWRLP